MLKKIIQRGFGALGYHVSKKTSQIDPVAMQARILGDCRMIFDVGANEGKTIRAYRRHFPTAHIHAFEPTAAFVSMLEKKARRDPRLTVHSFALSETRGDALLSLNDFGNTNSLLRTEANAPRVWRHHMKTNDTIRVETRAIDEFCAEHGIDEIDILKIDVQGAEALVLRGAAEMLGRRRVKSVLLEISVAPFYEGQSRPAEIFNILDRAGLTIVDFYGLVTEQQQLLQFDGLFALPEFVTARLT